MASLSESLVGTWELVFREDRTDGGEVRPEPSLVNDATGEVTQMLDGALAVENVGMVLTRRMEVVGDGLTLRLPTTAGDGTPVMRTLRWRRV